jgi:hypothetical protein
MKSGVFWDVTPLFNQIKVLTDRKVKIIVIGI